ncbi:MAG: XRE family transcriptional regulator, partial [Chloroflexi bacterium]|nr:XRE family transcriptional regulator [Chloroflexota bacterium]
MTRPLGIDAKTAGLQSAWYARRRQYQQRQRDQGTVTETPAATFADLLRQYRRAAGLTQEALAARAGLSVHGIQKLERGATHPYRHTAQRLVSALKLGPEDQRELANAVEPLRRHGTLRSASRPGAPNTGAPRHNLPPYRTPFVGRQYELQLVQSKLLRDDVALLTLTGPGGAGKSRLAVQAARAVLASFPDGVWFIALGAVNQPELVVPAIAQVFGLRDAGDQPLDGRLRDYLRIRQVLLILDNFEHVLSAAPEVARILADAPQVKVVVTSRALLRVSGEHAVTVPTLSLPRPGEIVPFADLNRYDAIRLFIERAQAVRPEFQVSADDTA